MAQVPLVPEKGSDDHIDDHADDIKKWYDAHPGEEPPTNGSAVSAPTTPDGEEPTPGPT